MYLADIQKNQGKEKLQLGASKLMEKASGLLWNRREDNMMMIPSTGVVGAGA
jgi:hypothetical protein